MEDFVSFEIAKKLKEKGFYYKCVSTYDKDGMLGDNYIQPTSIRAIGFDELLSSHNVEDDGCIDAPTISQVLKWVREEKKIYIVIQPFPTMVTKNKICWSWDFKWNSDGAYIEHTFPDDVTYTTYEQAALAGIEYVLDNLI